MTQPHVVAVTAGLSKPSSTRLLTDRLVEAAEDRLAAAGATAEVTVVELRDLAVDIANHLVTGFPSAGLRRVLDAVSDADGLIVVTPVFAGSYSGLFKSFFDLIEPDALTGTPVLLAATGGTARHSLVLEHALRPLFSYLHALTLPTAVFAATDDWGAGADTYAGGLSARVARAGAEFAGILVARGHGAPAPAGTSAAIESPVVIGTRIATDDPVATGTPARAGTTAGGVSRAPAGARAGGTSPAAVPLAGGRSADRNSRGGRRRTADEDFDDVIPFEELLADLSRAEAK